MSDKTIDKLTEASKPANEDRTKHIAGLWSVKKKVLLFTCIPLLAEIAAMCLDTHHITRDLTTPITKTILDVWLYGGGIWFLMWATKKKGR